MIWEALIVIATGVAAYLTGASQVRREAQVHIDTLSDQIDKALESGFKNGNERGYAIGYAEGQQSHPEARNIKGYTRGYHRGVQDAERAILDIVLRRSQETIDFLRAKAKHVPTLQLYEINRHTKELVEQALQSLRSRAPSSPDPEEIEEARKEGREEGERFAEGLADWWESG